MICEGSLKKMPGGKWFTHPQSPYTHILICVSSHEQDIYEILIAVQQTWNWRAVLKLPYSCFIRIPWPSVIICSAFKTRPLYRFCVTRWLDGESSYIYYVVHLCHSYFAHVKMIRSQNDLFMEPPILSCYLSWWQRRNLYKQLNFGGLRYLVRLCRALMRK